MLLTLNESLTPQLHLIPFQASLSHTHTHMYVPFLLHGPLWDPGVCLIGGGLLQPDFPCAPLSSDEEVDEWLKFYEMNAPLVCVGELVSHDPVSTFTRQR